MPAGGKAVSVGLRSCPPPRLSSSSVFFVFCAIPAVADGELTPRGEGTAGALGGEEGIEAVLGVGPDFDFPFKGLILFSFYLLRVSPLTEGRWGRSGFESPLCCSVPSVCSRIPCSC